jgi:uncharacterized lipoprotein
MKKLLALAAVVLVLSGCVVAPPYHDHGRRGNDQGQDYDKDGYHCPPGQAKKGRC